MTSSSFGFDDLEKIFFPHLPQKLPNKFVHYTDATAAKCILETGELWMRNARCMNDFMEVEYGFACVEKAYNKTEAGKRLKLNFDQCASNSERLLNEMAFYTAREHLLGGTFITSISEHSCDTDEDKYGRLSMWRAYGRRIGTAIVLNKEVVEKTKSNLNIHVAPVEYLTQEQVNEKIEGIAKNIETHKECLEKVHDVNIGHYLYESLIFSAVCIKHPGFKEEKEWRLVYVPALMKKNSLKSDVAVLAGTPQQIYKISLRDVIELQDIMDKIIIGPSEYPVVIKNVLSNILETAGVKDVSKKIIVSDIPLRS